MIPPQICEGRRWPWSVFGACPRRVEWAERNVTDAGKVWFRYVCARHAGLIGEGLATSTAMIPWKTFAGWTLQQHAEALGEPMKKRKFVRL